MNITLRPFRAEDLDLVRAVLLDRELSPTTWAGFRSVNVLERDFAEHGLLTDDVARLIVDVDGQVAGFVSYAKGRYGIQGDYYEIGILLRPDFRGRGIGWRAQAMLTDYLFEHMPIERVQAGTQPENVAEQKALLRAGFTLEGTIRAAEFRAGAWRDGLLYSRLRHDPRLEC